MQHRNTSKTVHDATTQRRKSKNEKRHTREESKLTRSNTLPEELNNVSRLKKSQQTPRATKTRPARYDDQSQIQAEGPASPSNYRPTGSIPILSKLFGQLLFKDYNPCQWNCFLHHVGIWIWAMDMWMFMDMWMSNELLHLFSRILTNLLPNFETLITHFCPKLNSLAGRYSQTFWWIGIRTSDLSPWICSLSCSCIHYWATSQGRFSASLHRNSSTKRLKLPDMTTHTLVLYLQTLTGSECRFANIVMTHNFGIKSKTNLCLFWRWARDKVYSRHDAIRFTKPHHLCTTFLSKLFWRILLFRLQCGDVLLEWSLRTFSKCSRQQFPASPLVLGEFFAQKANCLRIQLLWQLFTFSEVYIFTPVGPWPCMVLEKSFHQLDTAP